MHFLLRCDKNMNMLNGGAHLEPHDDVGRILPPSRFHSRCQDARSSDWR
jgi:hypothetical protein